MANKNVLRRKDSEEGFITKGGMFVDRETAADIAYMTGQIKEPTDKLKSYNLLAITTTINVYAQSTIEMNESGLTTLLILRDLAKWKEKPCEIVFKYVLLPVPRIIFS